MLLPRALRPRGGGALAPAAGRNEPWIIDTHAFAFSPAFLKENRLPEDLDGTFDTLAQDMASVGVAHTIATVFVTRQDDFFESVARGLERQRPRIAVQLNIPANRPDWAAANLRAAAGNKDVAGARAALSLFEMHPVDERLDQAWDACEAARLPVQVVLDGTEYSEPASFGILARQRPGLRLVLSVLGRGPRAGLVELARHDSIFFQVPGLLDSELERGEPTLLRWALRNLPAERIMFGSDRLGRERSYARRVRAIRTLDPKRGDWVGRATALSVYGERMKAWRG